MRPEITELLEHAGWVRRLALQLVSDAARADDVVQETWLRALEAPPAHGGNLRAWLGRVVTNIAAGHARSAARRRTREERAATAEHLPATDELVAETEQQGELLRLVLALPEPYRETLLLRYQRGLAPRRIAEVRGVPLATVKTHLQRGLARLRDELDRRHGDAGTWCALLLPLARSASPAELTGIGLPGVLAAVAATGLVALGLWSVSTPRVSRSPTCCSRNPRRRNVREPPPRRERQPLVLPRAPPSPRGPRGASPDAWSTGKDGPAPDSS